VEEMKRIEEGAVELGISKLMMMENAGSAISDYVVSLYQDADAGHSEDSLNDGRKHRNKLRILVVAGTGNNGGDCFVAARHLAYYSDYFEVRVILIGETDKIRSYEAAENFRILSKIPGISVKSIPTSEGMADLQGALRQTDVVIVGLFGTGFRGRVDPFHEMVIETINSAGVHHVVSVDVPSGLDARTGDGTTIVRSTATVTMYAPKTGMLGNDRARDACGRIITANIGVPL